MRGSPLRTGEGAGSVFQYNLKLDHVSFDAASASSFLSSLLDLTDITSLACPQLSSLVRETLR